MPPQVTELVETKNPHNENDRKKEGDYVYQDPKDTDTLLFQEHFSNLLFSGDIVCTAIEFGTIFLLYAAVFIFGVENVSVHDSMTLTEVANLFLLFSIVTRIYNSYLEACFFKFPKYRTQTVSSHRLKSKKEICGRDEEQLKTLAWHDKVTLLSQFALNIAIYYTIPGYYPSAQPTYASLYERIARLVLNHYILSFGMYWTHRALHVNKFLWDHIHSLHHYAKHPLSRNTYEDHWFDNFMNAIVGHFFAQILCPLDHTMFIISRLFRICESLEKHSGISCYLNFAHYIQSWLPFAQMPHHHDYHHEGFKGCNYTFTSIGGVWDLIFGTRKAGRGLQHPSVATREDNQPKRTQNTSLDHPMVVVSPVLSLAVVVGATLAGYF